MKESFNDLTSTEFISITQAKAKLSEQVRRVNRERLQLALTSQGKPKAVLLGYEDYLKLIKEKTEGPVQSPVRVITYEDYLKSIPKRREISRSVLDRFDISKLSRKGQKSYKRKRVKLLEY